MKGLWIEVYRSGGSDCSLEGISSNHDHLTLIGEGIEGPFAPTEDAPPVTLQIKRGYMSLVPCDENAKPLPGWWMYGGNIADDSDSRFPSEYPLHIHDRKES